MNLLELVEDFEIITIFRHQLADQDALGSQFGLKTFFEMHCPDKKVYAIGEDVGSAAYLFPKVDFADDESIKESIAFVLDSANVERIDDERFKNAKKVVKIDHHIEVEDYADESFVDTSAAATCEILASMFKESGKEISSLCATYLYYGLLADSLSFTTNATTPKTLQAAAYLLSCGVDVVKVKADTMGMSANDFYYLNEIRAKVKTYGKVAYAVMNSEEYHRYGMNYSQAKEKVFAMANVNEFEIWCLFTQNEDNDLYNGSLRSRFVAINEIANAFHGGGHKNACGVKNLTLEDIECLVDQLSKQTDN